MVADSLFADMIYDDRCGDDDDIAATGSSSQ